MADEYLLEMKDIVKTFPGVKALDGAGIKVRAGEVVALCGENGAGKSTLMKCLYGSYHADSGEIYFKGEKVNFKNPDEAKAAGVILIFQELSLITDLTVAENMFLGSQPKKGRSIDWKKMNADADKVLQDLNSTVKSTDYVRDLPISQQQMVEIARGIALGAKILILDEPTSSLTEREKNALFDIIRKLKKQGVGIIYISHKMDEIFDICDEAVVLRDGKLTGQFRIKDIVLDDLIQAMIGRHMDNYFTKCTAEPGREVLRVEGLTAHGYFRDITFSVREKEVVGFYGLVGAGRSEIMEAIFGVRHLDAGKIFIDGKEVKISSSVEAVKQSLSELTNEEVKVNVIHAAVGAINETDVMLADSSNAIIIGFNVRPDQTAEEIAARDKVDIRTYRVIYDAIEEIETAMKGMLAPKFREVVMGRIEVRQVYKISNVGAVAGAYVLNGKVTRQCEIRVVRDGIVIAEDKMSSLKRFKDDVKEVGESYECGITLEKFRDFKEGDIFEAFIMEEYRD